MMKEKKRKKNDISNKNNDKQKSALKLQTLKYDELLISKLVPKYSRDKILKTKNKDYNSIIAYVPVLQFTMYQLFIN